jgi:carotenoid 1,2-hydratase
VQRGTRSENADGTVVKTLEDTPFYARSIVTSRVGGRPLTAMHESLSLDRFVSPAVQFMLPFRMPRRSR